MKTISNKIFAALAFAALLCPTACVKDAPEFEVGEQDVDGCYGVYFPKQTSEFALEPTEPTTVTITLARTVSKGAITVPVELTDTTGIFSVSDVTFEDGQSESSAVVNFSGAQVGTNYSFYAQITDPQYASKYNSNPTALSLSVIREKWNDVGKAMWRDDFFTTFYNVQNVEYPVDVQENANKKGLYRFKNVYCENYPNNDPSKWDDSKDYWIVINATDSTKVYMSKQRTGCAWDYGEFYVSSMAGYYLAKGGEDNEKKAASYYGSLTNGCIKFPSSSLLVSMSNYESGALYIANAAGMFRVILPGGKDVDYNYSVSAELCKDGKVPVTFTLGDDITSMKYLVVEGALDARGIQNSQDQVINSEDAKTIEKSGTVEISCEKTGMYTVVAVAYADKVNKGCTGVAFGYVAPGEEDANATVVTAGLELTSRFEGAGYNKTNSVSFYVYGKDLTSVKLGILPTAELSEDINDDIEDLREVSDENLALINGAGYSDIYTGLKALTDYTLIVWASNGYTSTVKTAEITTDGLANVLLGTGNYTYAAGFLTNDDGSVAVDEGLEIFQNPNAANTYVIEHWCYDSDFTFTYDSASGKIAIPKQETGATYQGLPIYIIEYNQWMKYAGATDEQIAAKGKESSYDAASGTISFAVAYVLFYNGEYYGKFVNGIDTFVLAAGHKFPVASDGSQKSSVNKASNLCFKGFAGLSLEFSPRVANFSITVADRSYDKCSLKSNLAEFAE